MALNNTFGERSIRIHNNKLIVNGFQSGDLDIVRAISKGGDEKLEDSFETALHIGAMALDRAQIQADFDYMSRLADKIVKDFGVESSQIIEKTEKALKETLDGEDGKLFEPVRNQLIEVQSSIRQRLADVKGLIDPNNPQSDLGLALSKVRQLLDPDQKNSFPDKIESILAELSGKDGVLAKSVESVVAEAVRTQLAPLQTQVKAINDEFVTKKAVADLTQRTTVKGPEFEVALVERIRGIATAMGFSIEYTGEEKQPGDIVLRMASTGIAGMDLVVVIEAKDDANGRGTKRIQDDLLKAIKHRHADIGILVGKSIDAFGKEVGEWGEGTVDNHQWIACTEVGVRMALRWAVLQKRLADRMSRTTSVDPTVIAAQIGAVRQSLRNLSAVKTNSTNINKAVENINSTVDQLKREIESSIGILEDMV